MTLNNNNDNNNNGVTDIQEKIKPYLFNFSSLINDIGYSIDQQIQENNELADDIINIILERMNKFQEKINQLLLQKDIINNEITTMLINLNLINNDNNPDQASYVYRNNDSDGNVNNDQYTIQDKHIITIHKDLNDNNNNNSDNNNNQQAPHHQLYVILKQFQTTHKEISNIYDNREKILNKLYNEMKGMCIEMGIDVNEGFEEIGYPSSERIRDISKEIQKLKDIKLGAIDKCRELEKEIRSLYRELDSTPNNISSQQLVQLLDSTSKLNNGDLKSLVTLIRKMETIYNDMKEMKIQRENDIKRLNQQIKKSYVQLSIPETDSHRLKFNQEKSKIKSPLSVQLVELLQSENKRLNQLKHDRFKDIYDGKIKQLDSLWSELCIPESERTLRGQTSDDDKYSTENLEYIDSQITLLSELLDSMKAILAKVKRREFLKEGMKTFEKQASDDSNRFKGSSVRLLEEAKFRKIVSKEFPKLTEDLQRELAEWEQVHQKRFYYYGTPYLELMNSETERPDFDLLHLRLSTKNESLSGSSPMVSTTPLVQSKTQQTSPSPSTSKPRPFLKRTSMSSLPTSSNTHSSPLSASTSSLSSKTPSSSSSTRTPLKRESSVGVTKQR